MNSRNTLEERLEGIGSALRERPSVTDGVMAQVRQSLAQSLAGGSVAIPKDVVSRPRAGRNWRLATATVAAVGAMVAFALIAFPRHSVGWEDVNQAVKSQKWIRASVTYLDGQHATIWMSPERGIWAYKNRDRLEFADARRDVTYDYKTSGGPIVKRRPNDEDRERVSAVNFADKDVPLGGWLFGEKVLSQHRREVAERGRGQKWIEFDLVFWRGNRGTLRVDPQTRLPASLTLTAPKPTPPASWVWTFDYPTSGPGDIYALGAPATAPIEDRTPSDEGARVLDGMAASRSRVGDFRLDVVTSYGTAVINPGHGVTKHVVGEGDASKGAVLKEPVRQEPIWDTIYRVSLKGSRWRVDRYLPKRGALSQPPDESKFPGWVEDQFARCDRRPMYVCDGTAVYENEHEHPGVAPVSNPEAAIWHVSSRFGPGDLFSATGSVSVVPGGNFVAKVFPDRFGVAGWNYSFDPHPADAPGCVLWKLSARLATAEPLVGHEWYYIDPQKGDAVVRNKSFGLPPDSKASPDSTPFRSTVVMDDFRQSPRGFWYPLVIRETNSTSDPNAPADVHEKPIRMTQTFRYHFDFEATLSDSLFKVDAAGDPGKSGRSK
jgi:hypothetical protein